MNTLNFNYFIISGVIWSKTSLPGSGMFFKLMKQNGKTVNFVSNNSIRTKENYDSKFKAAGIENGFVSKLNLLNCNNPNRVDLKYYMRINKCSIYNRRWACYHWNERGNIRNLMFWRALDIFKDPSISELSTMLEKHR